MLHRSCILSAACLVAMAAAPLSAQQNQKPRKDPPTAGRDSRSAVEGRIVFSDAYRAALRRHVASHRTVITPLPPGIQKQLARGKPLPPGIARTRLSPELVNVAPRLERGYRYVVAGDNLVVVDTRNIVVDMLANLFR